MTIKFDNDRIFVLNRQNYREQHYLIDVFHCEMGRFRASARIAKTTHYRLTDGWAPFQEIAISGVRKTDLATIWHGELARHFPLSKKQLLSSYYLNELLLGYLPQDDPAPELYHAYTSALSQPSKQSYRYMEYQLIEHLGLVPEIIGAGSHYLLSFEQTVPRLDAAAQGFDAKLIEIIEQHDIKQLIEHPQAKSLFQQILHQQRPLAHKTRTVSRHLFRLAQHM